MQLYPVLENNTFGFKFVALKASHDITYLHGHLKKPNMLFY